jgi:hypothetical protein
MYPSQRRDRAGDPQLGRRLVDFVTHLDDSHGGKQRIRLRGSLSSIAAAPEMYSEGGSQTGASRDYGHQDKIVQAAAVAILTPIYEGELR